MTPKLDEAVVELAVPEHNGHCGTEGGLPDLQEGCSTFNPSGGVGSGLHGVVVGLLTGFDSSGQPRVRFPNSAGRGHVPARSILTLGLDHIGRQVVLMFEGGDPDRPIVMGLIQPPGASVSAEAKSRSSQAQTGVDVRVDGERLLVTAAKEIVLRCGKASLTLTRAGKVLIRGAYLLSRSSGVNRIKGGSVQIN